MQFTKKLLTKGKKETMNVQINDCTIRDGGYLLSKNSSEEFVSGVVSGLLDAGIDIIEIGFLQNTFNGESIVYRNSACARKYIPPNVLGTRFTGFCDYSRFSIENLDECDGNSFIYLRVSFAKHEAKKALKFISEAKKKGYRVFVNPMDAPSYSENERSGLISAVNDIKPYAFSIVDTFGTMFLDDLQRIYTQTDEELDNSIRIGLHSHNNLQLSNALAEMMIDLAIKSNRDIVVDGSLYGMGRGAGNASTEVLADYLNKKQGKNYDIGKLFSTIERYIIPCQKSTPWGYDLPMFICGTLGAHVDNIYYLEKNITCNAKNIYEILSLLEPEKRKRYGVNYLKTDFSALDEAYEQYKAKARK
ncbi:MAG: hypothetical protein LIO76_07100 [Clostridiales bacterium]|nr:hypothetical protein [Clostridiales bacterium]